MKIAYKNFTGGEISGSLAARYDLSKFASSCRHLENFIPELHGPLRRRMGSYFLEDLGAFSILLPFEFSSDPSQNYVIVVQEGKILIAQRYGFVRDDAGQPLTIASPYTRAQLYDICTDQSGDIMYIAHRAHPLHRLVRYGHRDWKLEEVSFLPGIQPPTGGTFLPTPPGGNFTLRYKITAVNEKGEPSDPALISIANCKHANDWVTGDFVSLKWDAVEGADTYNIYREEAGTFGLVGVTKETTFRDDKYAADTKDSPSEHQNPFKDGNNPGLVSFHQQRLILASTTAQPQTWHGSRTGNYEDFSKSRPVKDDDALEFTLASGRIDIIQWIAAFGDLVLGTAGSEYKAIGADQGVITPASLNVREQSYWGSVRVKPLIIGNSVLHIQRQGSRVRDLYYSLEKDGYAGSDLSVMASHLFDNRLIWQWAYQQSPGSTVWAVRDDGMMLVLTYMKEHEIWGWSRVTTEGKYRSVVSIAGNLEDDLYTVVEREINGEARFYLECFEPRWFEEHGIEQAFYVDSGLTYNNPDAPVRTLSGLDHLEGREVSILAEGSPAPKQVVRNGAIELPYAATLVHVGLPYRSIMCPQTPESDQFQGGASLGRVRSYGASTIDLISSVGGKYGPAVDTLYPLADVPDYYDTPIPPFTGFRDFQPGAGFDPAGQLWFVQEHPLPFTVAAMMLDVDVQGL